MCVLFPILFFWCHILIWSWYRITVTFLCASFFEKRNNHIDLSVLCFGKKKSRVTKEGRKEGGLPLNGPEPLFAFVDPQKHNYTICTLSLSHSIFLSCVFAISFLTQENRSEENLLRFTCRVAATVCFLALFCGSAIGDEIPKVHKNSSSSAFLKAFPSWSSSSLVGLSSSNTHCFHIFTVLRSFALRFSLTVLHTEKPQSRETWPYNAYGKTKSMLTRG